jgi:hypothetical protein
MMHLYGEILMQEQPQPPPQQPGPIDVHIDLSGLANLIWSALLDHLGDLGNAIWSNLLPNLPALAGQVLALLEDALRNAAQAIWDAAWGSSANIVTQIPPDLTYNASWYRAVATDPMPIAVGGATLALVLLGLRTLFGSMVGRDHVITHVTGRLIPAVFLTLAYPVLVVRAIELLNAAASALGKAAIGGGIAAGLKTGIVLSLPVPPLPALLIPYLLLWLLLIYFGVRLLVRLAYSIFRLLVALVFGPVALILWAIPQTEWVTWFWLRELVGWATTPLLVTACLALAIPLASLHSGILAGAVFSLAGLMAAYDLVGLLGLSHGGGGHGLSPLGYARLAARAGAGGGGGGAAAASAPAIRPQVMADSYGFR